MTEFSIKVSSGAKCYFCGRGKKDIEDIFGKMTKEIDEGIANIKEQIENLDNEFNKQETGIRNDMENIDLSYKINTLTSDRERFEKEIPHFELWTYELWNDILREYNDYKRKRMDLTIFPTEKIMNRNRYRNAETIGDVMDSLDFYITLMKERRKLELEEQLRQANLIKTKYEDHELKPLVSMASKSLGKNLPSMDRLVKGLPEQQDKHIGIIRNDQNNGAIFVENNLRSRYNMRERTDEVKFILNVCHFCYDRFQGSTI